MVSLIRRMAAHSGHRDRSFRSIVIA
jgi:hypothetical protein